MLSRIMVKEENIELRSSIPHWNAPKELGRKYNHTYYSSEHRGILCLVTNQSLNGVPLMDSTSVTPPLSLPYPWPYAAPEWMITQASAIIVYLM